MKKVAGLEDTRGKLTDQFRITRKDLGNWNQIQKESTWIRTISNRERMWKHLAWAAKERDCEWQPQPKGTRLC